MPVALRDPSRCQPLSVPSHLARRTEPACPVTRPLSREATAPHGSHHGSWTTLTLPLGPTGPRARPDTGCICVPVRPGRRSVPHTAPVYWAPDAWATWALID